MASFKLSKEQKIGLFAIITLAALYITVNYLKGKDLFSSQKTYYAVYSDVQGLTPTGPVFIKGLKIGTIETIEYNQLEDNFCVKIKVDNSYNFPTNSKAESFSSDIMGTRAISIIPGENKDFLSNKDTFETSSREGLAEMLSSEFLSLKKELSKLILSTDSTINNINSTISPQLKKEIHESVSSLNSVLKNTDKITTSLEKSTPGIEEIINNLSILSAGLNNSTTELNKTLANTTQITEELKEAQLAETIGSIRDLLIKLQDPSSTTGKLMTTDSLHNSIDRLVRDFDTLINNINENPKRYIKISVF